MTTRQECTDLIHRHASTASEMLNELSARLLAGTDDPAALLQATGLGAAGAAAHAATAQAWAAFYAIQFGATVRLDQP